MKPSNRITIASLIVLLATCVQSAHGEHQIGHSRCCGRQDVILIRGGAGYWPGAEDAASYFRQMGYVPTIIQHWQYATTADQIANATRQGRMTGGVILVGYSSGADAACQLASRLKNYGVRVQTMVLIESTFGYPVPSNVDYCVNYYADRAMDAIPMFRGVPVNRESRHTVVYNINVNKNRNLGFLARRNHFTIANSRGLFQLAGRVMAQRQPPYLRRSTQPAQQPDSMVAGEEKPTKTATVEDNKTTVQ